MWSRPPIVSASFAAILFNAIPSQGELREFEIIAEQWQPAAGFNGGVRFTGVRVPVIGAGGEIAFYGFADSPINRVVWSGPPDDLGVVTKFKDPVPETDPGDTMELDGIVQMIVCADGTVVFETQIDTLVAGRNRGIFAGKPGTLKPVALVNHPVPGLAGVTFHPFGWRWTANADGKVLMVADFGGAVTDDDNSALMLWDDGAFEIVARRGEQADGFPSGATYAGFSGSDKTSINANGEIAFAGQMRGNAIGMPDIHALWWRRTGGDVELVYEGRSPIPILPYDFEIFEFPRLTNDGGLAFECGVRNQPDGATRFGEHFFYRDASGQLSLLAREKEEAPGSGGFEFKSFLFYEPIAGGNDHPTFVGGFGPNAGNDQRGIWVRGQGGAIIPLLLEGTQGPGLAPGVTIRGNELDSEPCINEKGVIVCSGELEGPGIDNNNDYALWVGRPGDLKLVLQSGDTIQVTNGSTKTIRNFSYQRHGGGQDGEPTCLNDAGQFVFRISYNGGESIVMIDDVCDLNSDGVDDLLGDAFGGGREALPFVETENGTTYLVFRRLVAPSAFEYHPQWTDAFSDWAAIVEAPALHPDQSGLPAGVERVRVTLTPAPDGSAYARVVVDKTAS